MIEFKACEKCGAECSTHRDGECLACRPIEVLNLCGAQVTPGVLAAICTHLERWEKITVTNAAIHANPGVGALLLGIEIGKKEAASET